MVRFDTDMCDLVRVLYIDLLFFCVWYMWKMYFLCGDLLVFYYVMINFLCIVYVKYEINICSVIMLGRNIYVTVMN